MFAKNDAADVPHAINHYSPLAYFLVVLADQTVVQAVNISDNLNITAVTSRITIPVHLPRIISTVLDGDDELLLFGHPTMVAKLGINIEVFVPNCLSTSAENEIRCTTTFLDSALGVAADQVLCDALLTNRAPYATFIPSTIVK